MSSARYIVIAAGLASVVWGVVMVTRAGSASAPPSDLAIGTFHAASFSAPVIEVAAESDAERRQKLNARLLDMVREGRGKRLTDEPRARPAVRSAQRRAAQPSTHSVEKLPPPKAQMASTDISSIAPPPYRGGEVVSFGRGYVAPRLDLISMPNVPTSDVECLTQALYYEARNESEAGQAAVAEVVINRSRVGGYPRKICDVVYQRNTRTCQFTFTCDGSIGRRPVNMTAWARAERIARDVYEGRSQSQLPRNSVNYHANYVRPSWGARLERVRQIGAHIFYGAPLNGYSTPGSEFKPASPVASGLQFVRNDALEQSFVNLASQADNTTTAR